MIKKKLMSENLPTKVTNSSLFVAVISYFCSMVVFVLMIMRLLNILQDPSLACIKRKKVTINCN